MQLHGDVVYVRVSLRIEACLNQTYPWHARNWAKSAKVFVKICLCAMWFIYGFESYCIMIGCFILFFKFKAPGHVCMSRL